MRKRVLMLCYYYPPVLTSGSARSVGFSECLPDFGWDPVVLSVRTARDRWVSRSDELAPAVETHRTFEWDLTGLVDVLDRGLNWMLRQVGRGRNRRFFREILAFPDPQIAWFTTWRGVSLARGCDVIYATCSPASAAPSALLIGRLTRRPVVLDFRDAWAYDVGSFFSRSYVRALLGLEAAVVKGCDHLVLNTDGALVLYRERYPQHAVKMSVVPNGYDQLNPTSPRDPAAFRIVHAGTLYGGRDPSLLIAALEAVNDTRVEFVHLGERYAPLDSYQGPVRVLQTGIVSRREALNAIQSASVLYLRQGPTNRIAVAAKTYEYLATGLPILFHGPEGDNSEMVRRYGQGSLVVTDEDRADSIVSWIVRMLGHEEPRRSSVDEEFRRKFDRGALTKELVGAFERVAFRRHGPPDS